MEPGLHRSQRDPQLDGDVGQRHSQVVVQHDNGPPLRFEPSQGRVEKISIGKRHRRIPDVWGIHRHQLDFHDATPASTCDVEAGVNDQAVKPGREPLRIAKPGQVPPGAKEGVLDRVSCELAVPEDQACGCVQPRDGRAGKDGKGVMIALPRSLDETSLIHGRLSQWRGQRGRTRMVWRLVREYGSRALKRRRYTAAGRRDANAGAPSPTLVGLEGATNI